jgi:hypothetical protein
MIMNTKTRNMFLDLMEHHQGAITNALECHQQDMTEAAQAAQAEYDKVKDDPEARARLDAPSTTPGFINLAPTTSGLLRMAKMFTAEAGKDQAALDQLEQISEALEEGC